MASVAADHAAAVPADPAVRPRADRAPTLPALTGLRFFAALAVVLIHVLHSFRGQVLAHTHSLSGRLVGDITANGYIGVNIFFLLSGFILAYTYLDGAGLRSSRRAFYVARFARVYPVYLLGWLLFGGLVWWHTAGAGWPASPALTGALSLGLLHAWLPQAAYYWNGPGWSLSDEAFFYLAFPFVAVWLAKRSTRALCASGVALWLCLLVAAIADPAPPHLPTAFGWWIPLAAGNPLIRLPEFACGVVLGILFVRRAWVPARPGLLAAASVAALVAVMACGAQLPLAPTEHGILDPLLALLLYSLAWGRGPLARLCSLPPLLLLGDASYALYILHAPLFGWLDTEHLLPADTGAPYLVSLIGFVVVLTLLSLAVYRYLETPARRIIRRRWGNPAPAGASRIWPVRLALAAAIVAGLYATQQTAASTAPPAAIGFIGDSLSVWGSPSAPQTAAGLLHATAVDMAASGTTPADWLPDAQRHLLPRALAAFTAAHVRVVSVLLGTNSADNMVYRTPQAPAAYGADMARLVRALRGAGYVVMLQSPIYLVPGAYGRVTPASDAALRAYAQQRARLIDGRAVLLGDTRAYGFFAAHPAYYRDGIHLTQPGFNRLGAYWAAALAPTTR